MAETVGFLRGQLDRAYQEQTWAVALVLGLTALVLGQRGELLSALGPGLAAWAVAAIGALATLFVWSRHAIYLHHEAELRRWLDQEGERSGAAAPLLRGARAAALWSGVALYSALTLGLTAVSVVALRR